VIQLPRSIINFLGKPNLFTNSPMTYNTPYVLVSVTGNKQKYLVRLSTNQNIPVPPSTHDKRIYMYSRHGQFKMVSAVVVWDAVDQGVVLLLSLSSSIPCTSECEVAHSDEDL